MKKTTKVIEITEDLKLPGTNVILEKGDRVEVLEKDSTGMKESTSDARALNLLLPHWKIWSDAKRLSPTAFVAFSKANRQIYFIEINDRSENKYEDWLIIDDAKEDDWNGVYELIFLIDKIR